MNPPFPSQDPHSTLLWPLGGKPIWSTSMDCLVLWPPGGFDWVRDQQELRGNSTAATGHLLSVLPPRGFSMGWMYHLTEGHSFYEMSLSMWLSPHSSPPRFQKSLPLSSFVITEGGNSTKWLLAPGRSLYHFLWFLCTSQTLINSPLSKLPST